MKLSEILKFEIYSSDGYSRVFEENGFGWITKLFLQIIFCFSSL